MNYKIDIYKMIDRWYLSGERFLNIQSLPYTSLDILLNLFNKENLKILYITNEIGEISIIKKLESRNFKDYIYYADRMETRKINIVNFPNALSINCYFDLIIYDDLHCYPRYEKNDILSLILKLLENDSRAIALSVERIFDTKSNIVYPLGRYPYAFVEPIFIQTKVNLREDICTFAYDFINWSIRKRSNVIIYTPGHNRMYDVLKYLKNYYKNTDLSVLYTDENNRNFISIDEFNASKMAIIITNDFDDRIFNYENKNIILLFADSKLINYKQIINICGRVNVKNENSRSEIVLIGATQNKEVEKTLKLTRELNRIAWDSGFLQMQKRS
ncbi:MAG: hypothetical protein FWC47_03875 [Oscillospiraceae bacterium]|nr:hypothetical protein [Oscillospiraceae bacterium]